MYNYHTMSTDFPLPALTQESFTKYFGTHIENGEDGETILYPGEQLKCASKTSVLKKHLQPKHIFITKTSDGKFNHRVLGDDGVFTQLPKRLYAMCYPNISFTSIPNNNRVRVKLSTMTTVTLPFIPDSFYEQKKRATKRGSARPKRTREDTRPELTRTAKYYRGWNPPAPPAKMSKMDMLGNIRAAIELVDKQSVDVGPPIEGDIDSDEKSRAAFGTIVKFVYHYARGELGMPPEPPTVELQPSTKRHIIEHIE